MVFVDLLIFKKIISSNVFLHGTVLIIGTDSCNGDIGLCPFGFYLLCRKTRNIVFCKGAFYVTY